jgi:hypothetical protein
MNADNDLTDVERRIIAEVYKLLGDNLADFLLSGLGNSSISHRRTFTAASGLPQGQEINYQLEMINDSGTGLPIGRDPLVIAALLDLLWERQPLDSTILFREMDILEKLQWVQNAESQSLIKRALERYVLTAYCLIHPTPEYQKRYTWRYDSIGRLVIGFESTSILQSQKRPDQPRSMRIQFLPALIHDVISERKYFLGIDFQSLQKLRWLAL